MARLGILVTLKARPGKEAEVKRFLKSAVSLVEAEIGTLAWFAIQTAPDTFGIFDTFGNETDRQAHVLGEVAEALFDRADELFATPPQIEMVDVLAEKL